MTDHVCEWKYERGVEAYICVECMEELPPWDAETKLNEHGKLQTMKQALYDIMGYSSEADHDQKHEQEHAEDWSPYNVLVTIHHIATDALAEEG